MIDQMVKKLEYIPEVRIWQLFRGICEGVRVLHQQDTPVAHRSVTMDNTEQYSTTMQDNNKDNIKDNNGQHGTI